jgi:hypothetical protein
MANENPTGRGAALALTIPAGQVPFLRDLFEMARNGIRDELAEFPDQLREPARLRREETAYEALLAALDSGSIVVSDDTCRVLCELARMIDRENEYERVVVEHAALLDLRKQICEGAKR